MDWNRTKKVYEDLFFVVAPRGRIKHWLLEKNINNLHTGFKNTVRMFLRYIKTVALEVMAMIQTFCRIRDNETSRPVQTTLKKPGQLIQLHWKSTLKTSY